MARTQRLDQEKFPFVLILLLVMTSLGTISVLFFGSRSIYKSHTVKRVFEGDSKSVINGMEQLEASKLSLLRSAVSPSILTAEVVYIMPGGGSGTDLSKLDYPEWSRHRAIAAHKHSIDNGDDQNALFLALSAGSLNAPNSLLPDTRIVFECQYMINHLIELGVSSDRIFGDTMSWDTVTNAFFARQFLEGMLSVHTLKNLPQLNVPQNAHNLRREENVIASSPLRVEVFISDFHAERVKAAFNWIFNLEPSLFNGRITLGVRSVSTENVQWSDREEFDTRVKHEAEGVIQVQNNAKVVKTIAEMQAFLFLGPHKGLNSYLHSSYVPSDGAGWAVGAEKNR